MKGTVYIEREGRQFGLETRVRVRRQLGAVPGAEDPEVRPEDYALAFTFPVLRAQVWCLLHEHGWPRVI